MSLRFYVYDLLVGPCSLGGFLAGGTRFLVDCFCSQIERSARKEKTGNGSVVETSQFKRKECLTRFSKTHISTLCRAMGRAVMTLLGPRSRPASYNQPASGLRTAQDGVAYIHARSGALKAGLYEFQGIVLDV